MIAEDWLTVLSRISLDQPLDLDPMIFGTGDEKTASGNTPTFACSGNLSAPPSLRLWERDSSGMSFLGVRVTAPLPDCAYTALRLAAAAVERGVVPIVLTTLPNSGFERFGFRVERLPGGSADEISAYEDELCRFWNIAIIVDAAEVALIG